MCMKHPDKSKNKIKTNDSLFEAFTPKRQEVVAEGFYIFDIEKVIRKWLKIVK